MIVLFFQHVFIRRFRRANLQHLINSFFIFVIQFKNELHVDVFQIVVLGLWPSSRFPYHLPNSSPASIDICHHQTSPPCFSPSLSLPLCSAKPQPWASPFVVRSRRPRRNPPPILTTPRRSSLTKLSLSPPPPPPSSHPHLPIPPRASPAAAVVRRMPPV